MSDFPYLLRSTSRRRDSPEPLIAVRGRTSRGMSELGQKRPKLPWLLAAKSTTEQGVKFVPKGDLSMLRINGSSTTAFRSHLASVIVSFLTNVILIFDGCQSRSVMRR